MEEHMEVPRTGEDLSTIVRKFFKGFLERILKSREETVEVGGARNGKIYLKYWFDNGKIRE
jgi:hypothetical protein